MRHRDTHSLSLIVGTPIQKYVPQHFGGPTVAFEIRDSEQVQLSLEALDSEGNAASATTTWASSDETVATVSADGLVVASPGDGGLGDATITATVTDTSDGDTHEATFDITVVAGDAVTFNITAGAPEAKV